MSHEMKVKTIEYLEVQPTYRSAAEIAEGVGCSKRYALQIIHNLMGAGTVTKIKTTGNVPQYIYNRIGNTVRQAVPEKSTINEAVIQYFLDSVTPEYIVSQDKPMAVKLVGYLLDQIRAKHSKIPTFDKGVSLKSLHAQGLFTYADLAKRFGGTTAQYRAKIDEMHVGDSEEVSSFVKEMEDRYYGTAKKTPPACGRDELAK